MKNSMQSLIKMFPHFFDKSETSNFFKSQSVTNNVFKGIFQSISDVSDSFRLRKRCCIWKEQSVPYDYVINFVVNYPQLKSVKCYKNYSLLYMEEYLEEDKVSSFIYSYDCSEDNTIVDDNSEDNEEENQGDDSEIEIPIMPEDTFHIIAESYDEIIIKKGFPENDELTGDIYDHDTSLDEIGALNGIPRKIYIPTEDYANTEPPYNDRLTEDDYHYMNRILEYTLRLHDTSLPVLEIWKLYGIFADMVNREEYLLKMFDERMHPFDEETGLVGDWTPQPWEHKDTLCDLQADLGRFFFVSANTLLPVKNQNVKFNFKYLNSLAEPLTGDYNVTISLQGDEEDTVLEEHYTGEQYIVSSEVIADDAPNVFLFNAYYGETLFATEEIIVNVRGCNTGDWYVSTSGNDNNTGKSDNPFATLDKALSMCNGEENLIVLTGGTHTTDHIHNVPYTCTVLGCGDPIISNTTGLKFFKVYQNQSLNIQDVTLKHDDNTVLVENSNWINNNLTTNPLYVVISEGEAKTSTILTLSTNKSTYTIGETIEVTGSLTDDEETGLTGKSIKIYVNNTLVDTVTTQGNNGSFSKSITANISGEVSIKAVFEGDEDYYSNNAIETITVNKKTATITFAASKASYDLGETISLSGTLKSGNTNIGSASVKIYDGDSLLDTVSTNASGAFSKSISASAVASKTYKAVYEGDNTYTSVTSSDVSVSIVKRTPTISLATSSASVSAGGSYTLSGALLYNSSGVGSASIKIYDGATLIDTVTTGNDGTFTKSFTNAPVASHTYKAVYDGDSTYNNVQSSNVTVDVGKITPTISLSASSASIVYGNSVTLSGTLSVGSGISVKIYDGATLVDTVTTGSGGAFSKSVSRLSVGSHTFTAVYEGDSTYASVTSSGVSVTVTKITPTITLSVPVTGTVGTAYTVSGTLANPTTGSVKLYEGNTLIDTLTVTGGNFSKSITKNNGGTYTYYAVYEGDSTHSSVTSSTGSIVVSSPVTPASITLSTDKPIMMKDETATITATVLDGNGNPCEGETVSFEVVDGEDLGTAVTDSAGEAFVYYLGKGAGDLNIKAECMLFSEIYAIEDCFFYGINTDAFTIPSSTTFSSNGEYITVTTTTSSEKLVYLDHTLSNNDNWIFENEVARIGTIQSIAVIWNDNTFYGGQGNNGQYVYSYMGVQTKKTHTVQVGDKFTVKRENGVTSVYINDELIESKTIDHKTSFRVGYFINRSRTQYYKNIKLKPL